MQPSGYVDLFATKGIEYLLVIAFLLALILFWRVLGRPATAAEPAATPNTGGAWFRLADGLFYHQGHTWARPEADGVATVGLDDFAQRLLGSPSSLELPRPGGRVRQGGRDIGVRFGSRRVDILSPVAGRVVALNEAVLRAPGLVNDDPYGAGWLLKVAVPDMRSNLSNLLSGQLARDWLEHTTATLRRRMAPDHALLQDGGRPVTGMARELSDEGWEEIAREFLLTGK